VRAFLVLYWTTGIVVAWESVRTVLGAMHGEFVGHDRIHAILLGSLETLAALAFLVPRTMRSGALVLLAIFALAFAIHVIQGHPNTSLLVYGAVVAFVRVHGVEGQRWSAPQA
jgi:hypothetical protein